MDSGKNEFNFIQNNGTTSETGLQSILNSIGIRSFLYNIPGRTIILPKGLK